MKYSAQFIILCLSLFFIHGNDLYAANAGTINRHGVELGKRKLYREAVKEFDRAIEIYDKSSARTYHNKGWALELTGDLKGAIESYEEAVRRNPRQIVSGEKLGFLYYRTGDYKNAVRTGEMVLRYDPENREVTKWLPDAYIKKLKQEQEELAARKKEDQKQKKEEEIKKQKEEKKKEKEATILYATADFMIRTGYYFRGSGDYRYISDPGIVDLPESIFVSFTPTTTWSFNLKLENPFLGALSPNLVIHNETFDARYHLGDFVLGIGMMFNHYNSDIAFNEKKKLNDFKTGFIFGFKKEKMAMTFEFYPRLFPKDGSASVNKTLDVNHLIIHYDYTVNPKLKYYSIIAARDYTFFDHSNELSSYWGVYDIGIGVTLGTLSRKSSRREIAFSIEFIERFYLRDLENDKPYKIFNGQRFFGINSSKWLKGSPFSGFRALSQVLGFRVDEQINNVLFLYQKAIIEMGDPDEDHHEFNLRIGAGIII